MKALGILAGPRKGQTTDRVIDAVLAGAKERGAEIEKIHLYDYDIKPCQGCGECRKTHVCPIQDDHQTILAKMETADLVVFGSPSYISNVTGVAKLFMDRSMRFFPDGKYGLPKRNSSTPSKIVLVTSCGAPWPFSHLMGFATGPLRAMRSFFGNTKAKIRTIAACGMGGFDEKKCASVLRKAFLLGKTI